MGESHGIGGFRVMTRATQGLSLSAKEIAEAFEDPKWAERFPPVLSVDQAAALLQIPKATLYDWSSRRLLKGCSRRIGKHLRLFRNRLISHVFNEGIRTNE